MKKDVVVSASDVGKAAFCPHALSLAKRGGHVSEASRRAMRDGVKGHERLTAQVTAGDSRCYISSHAFGPDHPVTAHLRTWRDNTIKKHAFGRLFIRIYYAVSPSMLGLLPEGSRRAGCVRWALIQICRLTGGDHVRD